MKFTIEKNKLNEIIKQINSIVNDAALNVLFAHLLVKTNSSKNEVDFIFSNERISMKRTISNILIDDDFSFCLRAKIFTGIVSKLNAKEITLQKIDQTLNISIDNFESNINLVDSSLFPEMIFEEYKIANKIMTLDNDLLSTIYKTTSPTVAQVQEQNAGLVLTGIHFEAKDQLIKIVSTDSYRASYLKLPNPNNLLFDFIIEPSTIKNIIDNSQGKTIDIYLKNQLLYFVWENSIAKVKISLIGNYPSIYNHFEKEYDTTISIKNNDLIEMLEHGLTLVQNEKTPISKINITNDSIDVRYQSIDFGSSFESKKTISFSGNPITFPINTKFLLSILKIYDLEDTLTLTLSMNQPIVIKSDKNADLKHLVLPLRG